MNIMMAGNDSTITEFIDNYDSDTSTIDKYFLKQVVYSNGKKLLINADALLERYIPDLDKMKVKIELDNSSYKRYRYNPKVMAYDIYGTTEAWFLILHANEVDSSTEFNFRNPYIYSGPIIDFMSKIVDLEKRYIDYNEDEIDKELER